MSTDETNTDIASVEESCISKRKCWVICIISELFVLVLSVFLFLDWRVKDVCQSYTVP